MGWIGSDDSARASGVTVDPQPPGCVPVSLLAQPPGCTLRILGRYVLSICVGFAPHSRRLEVPLGLRDRCGARLQRVRRLLHGLLAPGRPRLEDGWPLGVSPGRDEPLLPALTRLWRL